MTNNFKTFNENFIGRDLVVGDIHGHFTLLQSALDKIGFNPETDRLFSVGDLVDRGPESHLALDWIAKPWFHAVRGNHEQMAIDWVDPNNYKDVRMYERNGGRWNIDNPLERQHEYAKAFAHLPLAIEIVTSDGLVGVVHAEPTDNWDLLRIDLLNPHLDAYTAQRLQDRLQWERRRIYQGDKIGVVGVNVAVVGHTPLTKPVQLGNVYYIDTGAWSDTGKGFTFLDVETLEVITVENNHV